MAFDQNGFGRSISSLVTWSPSWHSNNMDDLKLRLENATVDVARLLGERSESVEMPAGFQYLGTVDREVFAKKTIELDLEKKKLDLQEQQLGLMIRQFKAVAEIRQYVYREASGKDTKWISGRQRWLYGIPVYDN